MKRLLTILICLFLLLAPIQATAKNWTFSAHDGTTGGTTGKLDNIDSCDANGSGYDLQNKDGAIVWDRAGGRFLFYIWDSSSTADEVNPTIIVPDACNSGAHSDYPGGASGDDGRWILASISSDGLIPDAASGANIGTADLEFLNAYFGDGAVLSFGDDQDVNLTHIADTGLTTNLNLTAATLTSSGAVNISAGALTNDSVIDDDIDLAALTLADLTFDVGSVDTTEFGYLDGSTGPLQTQISAKVGNNDGSSTDNAVPRFHETGGYLVQDSGVIIDDSNNITGAASITVDASATPTVTFNDSGGAGVSKFAGKITMNMTTTTDDAETADIGVYAIYGGDVNDVGYMVAEYDGSAETWTFGDETLGEDLMFDFSTAGTVTVTSPGGGTIVDFSALAINTTGITTGGSKTPLAGTAADFDDNFTGAYLYGGTYRVTTAGACALPEPAVGMNFTILHEVAGASTIESLTGGTADTIFMNGLSAGSDDDLTASAVGAMCVFQYQAANVWMATCNDFTEVTPP